ncbi:hypothetical protein Scep_004000 [Stephania cephalantha]|uniref:Uncharacterized protein n=1 Tax=Stephania cephalantha TaxID=152367 RepID=A0AAP0KRP2_9MAGN
MQILVLARPRCRRWCHVQSSISLPINYERLWRLCIKAIRDDHGRSEPISPQPPPPPPPPPPPHDQRIPPQIDPADPPQQGDNVERETQEWLTRDEQLGDT